MEIKKNPKVDVNNKRTVLLEIGLCLALLAVMGIIVGVSNDAVNFLNSAFGSKVAKKNVILGVAGLGVMVGVMTSSGMMDVARSGVFYPELFSYQEIMVLFLGMMLSNIILLDIYNTLGLPTSTTVSLVFGLLGSALALALYNDFGPGHRIGQHIYRNISARNIACDSVIRAFNRCRSPIIGYRYHI